MKLPVLKSDELIKILEGPGFVYLRQKGSHARYGHVDGRVTTVPVHPGKDIPRGLLRKIIREDIKIELEEFLNLINK